MEHPTRRFVRPGDGAVQLLLSAMDGDWRVPAEPLDLTSRGARMKMSLDHPVPAAVGRSLTVWLVDKVTGLELPIEAKLVHRREEGGSRIVGVEFVDLRSVGGLLHPVLGRILNRRAAFRVTPAQPIPVTLVPPPDLNAPLEVGTLVDISTGGLAIDAPIAFEEKLGEYEDIECLFRLPGLQNTVCAASKILHRTLKGDETVRYGVQFLATDDPAFAQTRDAILGYVIRRQRDLAEEHELTFGTGIPIGALRPRT